MTASESVDDERRLGTGRILRFWWPLASTWMLMAVEGVFLAAVIARLDAPRENLAAYGVAFALAIIVESPVILLMSASTALVKDGQGYRALWKFTRRLNLAITLVMLVLLIPAVWGGVAALMGLESTVADLVYGALWWLLPWPAAIGDRRFHQGLLIRGQRTGSVAAATVVRLVTMTTTAGLAAWIGGLPGASVGGMALSVGVVCEMLAVRWMARPVLGPLRREAATLGSEVPQNLTQPAIARFYAPLALTSLLALATQPVITFFMGQASRPLDSLAVLPVLHGITFLFRALALSYQEVGIALVGERGEQYEPVRNVALGLAVAVALVLGTIAFTPLGQWWLRDVASLSPELAEFARLPLMIFALLPALSVLQSLQRAVLVHGRATGPMGSATAAELGALALTLTVLIHGIGLAGAVAAAIATLVGRSTGLLWLLRPVRRAVARYGAA
jgi:hypothetical protein